MENLTVIGKLSQTSRQREREKYLDKTKSDKQTEREIFGPT